ncbi:MAG: hypothetical protein K2L83_01870 [Muribaculaceae bacterium]|nr:hypothetical protein [Muribaculaceae bacterium]
MAGYFPYSSLVDLCDNVKQSLRKQSFFSEWSCNDSDSLRASTSGAAEISEIYY